MTSRRPPVDSLENLENYATAIGKVCIRFGRIDGMLINIICFMEGLSFKDVFQEIEQSTTRPLIKRIERNAERRSKDLPEWFRTQLDAVLIEADRITLLRNRYVHDMWYGTAPVATKMQFAASLEHRGFLDPVEVPVADVEQLVDDAGDCLAALFEVLKHLVLSVAVGKVLGQGSVE